MILTAYFSNEGTPTTGLSPTITVYKVSDNTTVVSAQAMIEIAGGFYKYDYTTYDENVQYVMIADGTVTLSGYDRYVQASNEIDTSVSIQNIRKVETNRWNMTGDQLIIYDDDGTTPIYTFDLKDSGGTASMTDVFERDPV